MSTSTQQLLLDLSLSPLPSLDNFITGRNDELLHVLRDLNGLNGSTKERCIYLWGTSGSGRTHLLQAVADGAQARYVDCIGANIEACLWTEDGPRLWAIDNVECAAPAMQIALFNLINEVRAHEDSRIVSVGPAAPLQLQLRDDLRSRLGWGLVFQVHPLNDAEKDAALSQHAAERSLKLSTEVRQYLLTHFARDMPTLIALIDALDLYAVQQQRVLTLPLLRSFAQQYQQALPHHA